MDFHFAVQLNHKRETNVQEKSIALDKKKIKNLIVPYTEKKSKCLKNFILYFALKKQGFLGLRSRGSRSWGPKFGFCD